MEFEDAISLMKADYLQNLSTAQVWADLGCGTGLFSKALSAFLPTGSKIFAIDKELQSGIISPKKDITIIFQQGDFTNMDFDFGNLAGVLMANSLHYVRNKEALIRQYADRYDCNVFLIIEYDTKIPVPMWVPYPINFESLKKLFLLQGFSSVTHLHSQHSVFHHGDIYAALIRR